MIEINQSSGWLSTRTFDFVVWAGYPIPPRRLGIDRLDWFRWRAEGQRSRFSPHFWIEVSNAWRPVTLMTSGLRRTVAVPGELLGLDDETVIIREAGAFVARHFQSSECRVDREHVNHYVYRPEFDRGYRFTTQGKFVERIGGLYLGSVSRVLVD